MDSQRLIRPEGRTRSAPKDPWRLNDRAGFLASKADRLLGRKLLRSPIKRNPLRCQGITVEGLRSSAPIANAPKRTAKPITFDPRC